MVNRARICSVSVDLDEIGCYAAIHGLQLAECHAVYDLAINRVFDFAASLDLPLTLFVIARDLHRPQNASMLRAAVMRGHEIGNHSLDHCYDLTRRPRVEQLRQVVEANEQLQALLDVRPQGFRAPGYTMTDQLAGVLREAELRYDSSVFPCPAYYAAKTASIVGKALLGRRSASVFDDLHVLRAPTVPYRTGATYWKRGPGLLELPIQVAGPLRLPFIGTMLTLLGPRGAQLLTRSLLGLPFVNLELHGLDFLDSHDVPLPLLGVQPDLRVPVARKLQALEAALQTLRSHGYTFARLDEAALAMPTV